MLSIILGARHSVSKLAHTLLKNLRIWRVFIFVRKKDISPRNPVLTELPSIFEILMKFCRVQVIHNFTIFLANFLENILIMKFQKWHQRSVLQENRFLINLKISVSLSQIVHFSNQKFIGSTANFVLELIDLWLDWLKTLGILTY